MTGIFHIVLARKPLEGTVAENCLQWGCGALWIDGTRVGTESIRIHGYKGDSFSQSYKQKGIQPEINEYKTVEGRWPANLIHDGSDKVLALFPQNIPPSYRKARTTDPEGSTWSLGRTDQQPFGHTDSGSASRFFFNFAEQESDE